MKKRSKKGKDTMFYYGESSNRIATVYDDT